MNVQKTYDHLNKKNAISQKLLNIYLQDCLHYIGRT